LSSVVFSTGIDTIVARTGVLMTTPAWADAVTTVVVPGVICTVAPFDGSGVFVSSANAYGVTAQENKVATIKILSKVLMLISSFVAG
jgi:hypothetical protein